MNRTMQGHAMVGNERVASNREIEARAPSRLDFPVRELREHESLVLGLRMNMVKMGDVGRVDSGGGCGTDYIILEWKGRSLLLRGSELLRAWVAAFASEDADRFPPGIAK